MSLFSASTTLKQCDFYANSGIDYHFYIENMAFS